MADTTPRPPVTVAADLRLTSAELGKLTPEQVKVVFEGVGKLAALTVADRTAEPPEVSR